jgi:hypothetical protein
VILWFIFWTYFGFAASRALILRLRPRERWSFAGEEIVAGANWQFTQQRKLLASPTIQVRKLADIRGVGFEFVSQGQSVYLGPFESEELAGRFASIAQSQQGHWNWT